MRAAAIASFSVHVVVMVLLFAIGTGAPRIIPGPGVGQVALIAPPAVWAVLDSNVHAETAGLPTEQIAPALETAAVLDRNTQCEMAGLPSHPIAPAFGAVLASNVQPEMVGLCVPLSAHETAPAWTEAVLVRKVQSARTVPP